MGQAMKWLVTVKPTYNIMDKLESKQKLTWLEIMGNSILSEHRVNFAMNFKNDIYHCISGAELMEYLTFVIPQEISMIAIQKDFLHDNVESVNDMINKYNDMVESLTIPQVNLNSVFLSTPLSITFCCSYIF